MNPSPTTPMVYVCVVSGYNLPELEACLARKPSDIVLLTSKTMHANGDRLIEVLETRLSFTKIHPLKREFSGEDLMEFMRWTQSELIPYLESDTLRGKLRILNLNGGTKVMSTVLMQLPWQAIDYKTHKARHLQVVQPIAEASPGVPGGFIALPDIPISNDVLPADVARLHGNHVEEGGPHSIVKLHPGPSAALACAIWQAQEARDPALSALFEGLERVWISGRDEPRFQEAQVTLPWRDFLPVGTPSKDTLTGWLERFKELAPLALSWNEDSITLPGNNAKKHAKHLKSWISGYWLEQLAYQWLIEAGLPPQAIAANLISTEEAGLSSSGREVDILTHYKGQTRLIEIKAGLPKGHAPSELENQVSALGDRFGSTSKALLLGPKLRQQLEDERRLEDFRKRCKSSKIVLLGAKPELIEFVDLS